MKKGFILILFSIIGIISCNNVSDKKGKAPIAFPFPNVPAMVSSEEEAMNYVSSHFWNKFLDSVSVNTTDSVLVGGVLKSDFQKALFSYVELITSMPINEAMKAQNKMLSLMDEKLENDKPSIIKEMLTMFDYFLYDANSNYRNEELYIPILQFAINSKNYTDIEKQGFISTLEDCSLNRINEKAADFRYTSMAGKTSTLHKIKAEKLIMFFSNPGCNACYEIIQALSNIPEIKAKIDSKEIKVLNLYIDEDLAAWADYASIYPKNWINAYEPDLMIKNVPLYSVRAIPSLYLLDKDKRVLLKDAPLPVLLRELSK